ncbi:hypothetical protein [Komagataeibacter diospyri]|nr:hypothetical protein [Komagataeibacter diospyri]
MAGGVPGTRQATALPVRRSQGHDRAPRPPLPVRSNAAKGHGPS